MKTCTSCGSVNIDTEIVEDPNKEERAEVEKVEFCTDCGEILQ